MNKNQENIKDTKNAKEMSMNIMDAFEEFLEEHGITISCKDKDEERERNEDECSARIYGSKYYELESRIQEILEK